MLLGIFCLWTNHYLNALTCINEDFYGTKQKNGIQFELNYSLSCTVHGKVSNPKTNALPCELFLFPESQTSYVLFCFFYLLYLMSAYAHFRVIFKTISHVSSTTGSSPWKKWLCTCTHVPCSEIEKFYVKEANVKLQVLNWGLSNSFNSVSSSRWPLEGYADGCLKQPGSHSCHQNTNSFHSLSQLLKNSFLSQFFADKKLKSYVEFECPHILLRGQRNPLSHNFPRLTRDVEMHLLRKIDWFFWGNFVMQIVFAVIVVRKSEIQAWLKEMFFVRSRMPIFKRKPWNYMH